MEIEVPEDGVMIHGLFMEAMRWDDEDMVVADSLPGEMNPVRLLLFCPYINDSYHTTMKLC